MQEMFDKDTHPVVMLINPNVYHSKLGTISPWEVPPLGLAYLAAVLEKKKINVSIIDAFIDRLTLEDLERIIEEKKPNVVGISANAYAAKYAKITAHFIKRKFPNKIIVLGGAFPTVSYEQILKSGICDVCVLGEGEITFTELISSWNKKNNWDQIEGIAFYDNSSNQILKTPSRKFIDNLDDLPFPSWHLFPNIKKYRKLRGNTHTPYLPMITSRGCPYSCNWCNKTIHGYKYRSRTPENVVEEIKFMVKTYHVKEIAIMDDTFTLNAERVKKICYLIKKEKIQIYLNLYNGTRADTVTDSILKYLISVGFNRLTMGVESGNQDVLDKIGKRINLDQIRNTVKLAKKYHLIVDGFFIIGHIFDSPKTIKQTIKFALDNDFDHAYFFTAMPFAGTKLYDLVNQEGKFLADFSQGSDFHIVEGIPAFETSKLTAAMISNFYRIAYKQFYLRPKRIIKTILLYSRLLIQYGAFEEILWLISQAFHLLNIQFKK